MRKLGVRLIMANTGFYLLPDLYNSVRMGFCFLRVGRGGAFWMMKIGYKRLFRPVACAQASRASMTGLIMTLHCHENGPFRFLGVADERCYPQKEGVEQVSR